MVDGMETTLPSEQTAESFIARAIRNYESRPQQAEMARAVADAMENNRHLIVEAGTGVGKSSAYLVPAIQRILSRGKKIVISTFTIALQEQLIEKDIPALAAVFDKKFKAVLVKGRHNYVGLRRLMQASRRQQAVFSGSMELDQLHHIEDWAYETQDGSLSDLDFQPLPQLWQRVRSESNNCMGNKCDFYQKCFYQRARRVVEDAVLLVVNHALFFADLALRANLVPPGLRLRHLRRGAQHRVRGDGSLWLEHIEPPGATPAEQHIQSSDRSRLCWDVGGPEDDGEGDGRPSQRRSLF